VSLVRVASLRQVPPGEVIEVTVEGVRYAICNVDGRVHALSGDCLHRGGPLGYGRMNGYQVVCPWHLWEFDCRTGAYDRNPEIRLPTYPVRVEGDDILIELP